MVPAVSAATGQHSRVWQMRNKPAGPWWLRTAADLLCQAVKFEGEQDNTQPTMLLLGDAAKPQIPPFIIKIVGGCLNA